VIYQNDILPTLTTKRILLSNPAGTSSTYHSGRRRDRGGLGRRRTYNREENQTLEQKESKIKVEFLIRSKEGSREYSWFTDQSMAPFIRAHFIILDDSTAEYLPRLVELESRRAALEEIQTVAPHTSVTLTQILRREFHVATPTSEMGAYYVHDIYHEVELDVPNYSKTENENIHLISFFHLDVEGYMQQNNINSNPEEIESLDSIGGSLVYDHLLKKENNRLIIPSFRNIYFIETERNIETPSGTVNRTMIDAYSGPVHYHGPDNPGPNGYLGWMAGPPNHGQMGPPLQQRQVRNYKVISDSYFSENAEFIFSINCDTHYSDTLSENLASAHLDPFSDPEGLSKLENELESLLNKSCFLEEKTNRAIVDYGSRNTAHINVVYDPNDPTGIPLQQSNYGCVVGIDFLQIVKNNSHFGNIIKFHHDKGNMDIINDVLYKSFITKMSVLRNRVKDHPTTFSDQCTLRYKRFTQNEPDKLLVHAEDRESVSLIYPVPSSYIKGRLIAADTPDASIEEVDLLNVDMLPDGAVTYTETPEHLRSFVVRDRDLFHNYSTGKYTYTFEISVNDGAKTLMSDLASSVYKAREMFFKYYFEATIPVQRNNGSYVSGNYDIKLNDFHESFKERDFNATIAIALGSFSRLVLFLTGDPLPESDLESLRASLLPSGTTISTLENFNRVLESLESALLKLLLSHSKYHDPYKDGVLRKKKQTNVKSSPGFETNTINVRSKTGIFVDAFSETTLMADFSIREVHDANDSVPNIARLFEENQERANIRAATIRIPRRFITVSPAAFRTEQNIPMPSDFLSPEMDNASSPQRGLTEQISMDSRSASNVPDMVLQSRAQYSTTPAQSYKPYLEKKRSKNLSEGGIKEVSKFSKYRSSTTAGKAAIDIKIDTVRILDSQNTGIVNKGHAFFPNNLMHYGGGIQFGPSHKFRGFTPNISLFDPNSPTSDNRPNISSALRKVICEAAYKGEDPQSVLDAIENIFEDIVITRQELGDIFGRVMSFLGNTSRVVTNMASVSFENKYLGNEGVQQAQRTLRENSYEKEKAKLSIIGPQQDPKEVNIVTLASGPRMSTRNNKKFVFAKFDTMKKEDNVISVNNGYLLEV